MWREREREAYRIPHKYHPPPYSLLVSLAPIFAAMFAVLRCCGVAVLQCSMYSLYLVGQCFRSHDQKSASGIFFPAEMLTPLSFRFRIAGHFLLDSKTRIIESVRSGRHTFPREYRFSTRTRKSSHGAMVRGGRWYCIVEVIA